VKVADMAKLVDFRKATLTAASQYHVAPYLLSSNRFTSAVMKQANHDNISTEHD
jgi:hypothetical protein